MNETDREAPQAAGVVMYRRQDHGVEVLLVRPGDPFRGSRDEGAWSIPKGAPDGDEDLLHAARRHLGDITGMVPETAFFPLAAARTGNGTVVYAWAVEGDWDPRKLRSRTFEAYWPPGAPVKQTFRELDRAEWFSLGDARRWISAGQAPLLDELRGVVGV